MRRIYITPVQRHVLEGLAADPQRIPQTGDEFDAYTAVRNIGLAEWNEATKTVTPTALGYEVLKVNA